MKKFLAIVAIASLAVACNNSGEKKTDKDTTTVITTDTTTLTPPPAPSDTAKTGDTATGATADTTRPK